ncbi:MAG: hypothetical protein ABI076_04275 [Acidobacteriaceae bacterium]
MPPTIPDKPNSEETRAPAIPPPGKPVRIADDGTTTLLIGGFWITLVGLLLLLLTETVFGGIGIDGARSNAGWIALVFALMTVPFGVMLLVLGIAKWLRKRRLRRHST